MRNSFKTKNGNIHKYYYRGNVIYWETPWKIESFEVTPDQRERARSMGQKRRLFNWYRNYKQGDCPV